MASVIVWDGMVQIPADVRRALIVARDGFWQLKRLIIAGQTLIEAVTKIGSGWEDDGLEPWGDESLRLGFAEKIPLALLQQTVAFFKAVYETFHSEAIVSLFYAPMAPDGKRWQLLVPEQEVELSHCRAFDPGAAPPGWFLAGDIHSHGGLEAFHSGVDDHDEDNRDGIHITVGGVSTLPNFSVSVTVEGARFKLDLGDIIEGIAPTAFPEEWMNRVRRPAPKPAANILLGVGKQDEDDPLAAHRAVQRIVRPSKRKKGGLG